MHNIKQCINNYKSAQEVKGRVEKQSLEGGQEKIEHERDDALILL